MSIGLKDSNMNRMKELLINFLITRNNAQYLLLPISGETFTEH